MEKVSNSLFFNYFRQNGKPFTATLISNIGTVLQTGYIHIFPEFLVPGTSDKSNNMLEAAANSIFVEARSHNMSLSPFGHNDPVKFCIAGTYVAVLMAELLGDISVVGVYQFGNANFGKALCLARDIDIESASTDFANLCKAYNMLVAKVNSLYIPVTGFVKRWMEHRRCIYKDDEGDRYSLYTYKLGNYYHLITDPSDPKVGQLVCEFVNHEAASNNDGSASTLADKIALINRLVDAYLADEDFAEFCTEALQAKMQHLLVEPLKSVSTTDQNGQVIEKFVGPELKLVYSLDDILGLENAYFWHPAAVLKPASDSYAADWNIREDATTGALYCGRIGNVLNELPVFGSVTSTEKYKLITDYLPGDADMGLKPIFTHAKVTSLPGITNLTRYIGGTGGAAFTADTGTDNRAVFVRNGTVTYTSGNLASLGMKVATAKVHGTEMLGGHLIINTSLIADESYFGQSDRVGQYLIFKDDPRFRAQDTLIKEAECNLGLKARFVTYLTDHDNDAIYPFIADFDYITTTSTDALNTFFGANAWNDIQLLDSQSMKDMAPGKSDK